MIAEILATVCAQALETHRIDEIGQHLVVQGVVARLTYDVIVGLLCARSSLHPQPKHIQSLHGIFHGIKQANQRHTNKLESKLLRSRARGENDAEDGDGEDKEEKEGGGGEGGGGGGVRAGAGGGGGKEVEALWRSG